MLRTLANINPATQELMRACDSCENPEPDYRGRVYVCEWHHGYDQGYTVGKADSKWA